MRLAVQCVHCKASAAGMLQTQGRCARQICSLRSSFHLRHVGLTAHMLRECVPLIHLGFPAQKYSSSEFPFRGS